MNQVSKWPELDGSGGRRIGGKLSKEAAVPSRPLARFLSYPSPKSQEDVIKLSPSRGKPRSKPKDSSDLQTIPGIGPSLAVDLLDLGYRQVSDLRAENPEAMYRKLCRLRGTHQDRCVLYVFRCAVYYASRKRHHPERLKWWNWSDEKMARRSVR